MHLTEMFTFNNQELKPQEKTMSEHQRNMWSAHLKKCTDKNDDF